MASLRVASGFRFLQSLGGGSAISVGSTTIPTNTTGVVTQLTSSLGGVVTFSKVSGSSNVTVSSAGAVTLASAIAAGDTNTFIARSQNDQGDAVERSVTLRGYSAPVAPSLNVLTVSISAATVGNAFTATVSGKTAGSTLSLTGTGSAGLSVTGNVISGTPTTVGPINVVETLSSATNSPRTTSGAITVAVAAVTIGGVALGTVATSGPEAGMTLVYGDDFDGPLDLMGPAPANRFGRYATTRGNYLIYDTGQQPRASSGLGGVDVDPLWTGHYDSNRGVPISSMSDMIVQENGRLSLRQRDMTSGEASHVPLNNQNVLSSMFHTAFDVMFTAPYVVKTREQRFANYRDHMTTWFMNYMGFTRSDIELDFEAASKKTGQGDGRQLEFNINVWDGVNRSDSRSSGSTPVTVDWNTPKTLSMYADPQGVANFYFEDQLSYQFSTETSSVLAQPYHLVGSNHMYNVTRPSGVSRLEYDWFQVWVPGKHYVPKVAPTLLQTASGQSKTIVIPSQADLWGETGLTEKIEACMVEPNEPGGTTTGGFYTDLPPGVTYNASTRELTVNVTTPGRLNIGMYVIKGGCSCKVFRIAVEVGPVINIANINVTRGVPFSLDLYKLVDCGILVTDGIKKTKKITVTGLPNDLVYDDVTGILSGTTNAVEGITNLTVVATNSVGQSVTRTVGLNVASAGGYAYQSLAGIVGRFDGSRDASFNNVTSGDFTTLGNAVTGGGDLAKATTLATSPQRVANQLNGLSVMRFIKTTEGGSVVESAQNSSAAPIAVAGVLTGSNTAFTQVWLVKFDTGSGTCVLGGPSEQVSSSAARVASIVKRDPASADSSFRYGATTATSADINIGRLPENVWLLIIARHNANGTSDVWVNDTQVATAVAHTSSSVWQGTARFSLGNSQGSTGSATRYAATAFGGYMAEHVFYASAPLDSDVAQIRADFKTKWKYNV